MYIHVASNHICSKKQNSALTYSQSFVGKEVNEFFFKRRAPSVKIVINDLPRWPDLGCCLVAVRLWFWPAGVAAGGNICIFLASTALSRGPCRRLQCCRWSLSWSAHRGAQICIRSRPESSCPVDTLGRPEEWELSQTTGRSYLVCH